MYMSAFAQCTCGCSRVNRVRLAHQALMELKVASDLSAYQVHPDPEETLAQR